MPDNNIEKQDKILEAIAKVIQLTRDNSLTWIVVDTSNVQKTKNNDIISSAFCASYKQKILRIYKRQYQGLLTMAKFAMVFSSSSKNPESSWFEEIILEIVNEKNVSLWVFPKEDILKDLLKTIKYKVSGAEDLINSLIK